MKLPISKFKVYGNSMFPTLREGQEVLTFNWVKVKVGDVVVIRHHGKEIIKRVQQVKGDKIYAIGDKLDESSDSRHFGAIPGEQIVGKVVYMR